MEKTNSLPSSSPMNNKKDFLFTIISCPIFLCIRIFRERIKNSLRKTAPPPLNTHDAANNFVTNIRNMNAICRASDITFFSVLQPLNGLGNRDLTESDKIILSVIKKTLATDNYSVFDFINEYYSKINRELRQEKYFRDFTKIFDEQTGQIFFDTCHFSDKGQELVAQALFEMITEEKSQ